MQDAVVTFMIRHIRKGDHVMDIGANRGTYTYSMARAVGGAGRVYSFEPNPVIAKQLRNNISAPNVMIENLAVSDTEEDKVFYRHTKGAGPTSSLEFYDVLAKAGELEEVTVRCVTLDSYCRAKGLRPALIKVDVEGHEFNVFRGAAKTIVEHRPVLVFEFIEQLWESKKINEIFSLLAPAYRLIRIEDGADALAAYEGYQPQSDPDFRTSRVVNIGCIPRKQ
ncbi:MAG: hypothetical protein A2516_02525 [Alphaproteobacteria bacterium RIFOXYD12_FULL_60_8]|nr:MAG: hypothetical protein A2516_02525 [Alphaproteobacteria bacterium RIFOXYD12_FULL_60_8]